MVERGDVVELSLVLACFNEEPWLEHSVREIVRELDFLRLRYEIIFVDDGSEDGTRDAIQRSMAAHSRIPMRAFHERRNTGWGHAVAHGLRESTGEIAGFLDVDLEIHPRYVASCCLAIRQGADVAVGARTFKLTLRSSWRRLLGWVHERLVLALLPGFDLKDTGSGCKFFRRKSILPVLDETRDPGWFWDTEMTVRCRLAGLTIARIPCLYIRNPAKPSSVRVWRDAVTTLAKLVSFRKTLRNPGLPSKGAVVP